ncbi:MAG TPA: hypothetical protein VHX15_06630 [Frankiaceae bacterium]|nr:hypothetical protein [Frankiaceae bacterium]
MTQQTAAPVLGESLPVARPAGLWQAVVVELKRCFRPPAEIPLILAANAALMCGGWFLLPDSLRDWLFSIHGALAFPIVLESWMLADVPSTNVLGGDAAGALAALGDGRAFQRFLYAKSLALWLLSAPICAAVAIVIGTSQHHHFDMFAICAVILAMPLGVLGISAWVGILFPYHPRSLRWRWAQRCHSPGSFVRWVLLVLTPYNFVPVICGAVLAPALLLTRHGSRAHVGGLLSSREFSISALVCVAMAFAAFVIGHAAGGRMAERRHARLVAYLTDPDRG